MTAAQAIQNLYKDAKKLAEKRGEFTGFFGVDRVDFRTLMQQSFAQLNSEVCLLLSLLHMPIDTTWGRFSTDSLTALMRTPMARLH